MNAPLRPEVLNRRDNSLQADLPLTEEGVLRYVWESQFGPMLIEVKGGHVDRAPKGLDISSYSQLKLDAIARQLNERPRKARGFQTPAESSANMLR